MKVILLKDVPKVGRRGEVKEVSAGLANNMLFGKRLAVLATKEALDKHEKELRSKSEAKVKAISKAEQDKLKLERHIFPVKVKVGDKGQIFSGIHEKEIAEIIFKKTKIEVHKSQIVAHHTIKQLGEQIMNIKLAPGVIAKIKINLVPR